MKQRANQNTLSDSNEEERLSEASDEDNAHSQRISPAPSAWLLLCTINAMKDSIVGATGHAQYSIGRFEEER